MIYSILTHYVNDNDNILKKGVSLFHPNLIIVPTIVGTGPNLSVKLGASQL